MARKLPHLLLVNEHERASKIKKRPRGKARDEESLPQVIAEEAIQEKAAVFSANLAAFGREQQRRESERNPELQVPATLTSVEIEFHDWFDAFTYERRYYGTFGLRLNKYAEYNTRGLFTVVDRGKFDAFLDEFRSYIACRNHANPTYNKLIRYVKSFEFHSTERINSRFRPDERDAVYLSIVSVSAETAGEAKADYNAIEASLQRFLSENKVITTFNPFTNAYELKGANSEIVNTIARNFDVVHTISSSSYGGMIRETKFGLPTRDYPFTIASPAADLPTIGVIDTGVSQFTPLSALLVANDYSVAGGDASVDNNGHGTAVAAFAALGHRLAGSVRGQLDADARILPMKVLSGNHGYISHQDVGNLIIRARRELNVRIFVLAVGYTNPLRNDEPHSDYAFYLDQLAQELDVLIVIATGNYKQFCLDTCAYPSHYLEEETNLCSPAESMNNLTVGAVGANLETELPFSPDKFAFMGGALPAAYSRKFHLNDERWRMPNKRFFKPDVVYAGGDYTQVQHDFLGSSLDETEFAGLQYLSIEPGKFFERGIGTSYSAPLVANIAARLLRKYPDLRLQTIKALIVNGAKQVKLDNYKEVLSLHSQRSIVGNGVPEAETCMTSSDSEVTVVIQDKIDIGTLETILVRAPTYLNDAHKNPGLLEVTATLCFAIKPVSNYPIAYCPVHMAFGVFRAIDLEGIEDVRQDDGSTKRERIGINGGQTDTYKFKEGWSQDAFYKPKPLTNTQKMSFYISREHLRTENNQFKVAVECHFHKLLPEAVRESLPTEYEYSLVLRFRENVPEAKLTESLYDQLQLCNNLEVLGEADLDAQGDLDLTIEV